MPQLVASIIQIEGALLKTDEWTDIEHREPIVPQTVAHRTKRDLYPSKADPKPHNNSSKKIMQHFDYQFRALGKLVDEHNMDPATVDQAEAMIKALESMRAFLDKFDDVDMEDIVIDRHTYNISDTLQFWLKCIFTAKDRNKKREKKEEKLKSER